MASSNTFASLRLTSGLYAVLLILVGLFALAAPIVSTLAMATVIGVAFALAGAFAIYAAFTDRRRTGALLVGLWGLVAFLVGLWIAFNPVDGAFSLTVVIGAVLVARGITTIAMAFDSASRPIRLWLALSGLISLALGGLLLANISWAASMTLGTIVGVDLLFSGIMILTAALIGPRAID